MKDYKNINKNDYFNRNNILLLNDEYFMNSSLNIDLLISNKSRLYSIRTEKFLFINEYGRVKYKYVLYTYSKLVADAFGIDFINNNVFFEKKKNNLDDLKIYPLEQNIKRPYNKTGQYKNRIYNNQITRKKTDKLTLSEINFEAMKLLIDYKGKNKKQKFQEIIKELVKKYT